MVLPVIRLPVAPVSTIAAPVFPIAADDVPLRWRGASNNILRGASTDTNPCTLIAKSLRAADVDPDDIAKHMVSRRVFQADTSTLVAADDISILGRPSTDDVGGSAAAHDKPLAGVAQPPCAIAAGSNVVAKNRVARRARPLYHDTLGEVAADDVSIRRSSPPTTLSRAPPMLTPR